ncbi:cell division protein FtsX [Entomobacter blattae]|uniref:Cell division protein FtsX n=1 Tax=Entomobacter blattae TaxID=2762277 RepID=A0A7H1NUY2_9PROT|nr:FtsX-like permease family protein [Entomobacter blattae]QNT79592.1 hypothetical protein JGUZn3_23920 [Entomobacter blattae]
MKDKHLNPSDHSRSSDGLSLRKTLVSRLLPFMVAAMGLLASFAFAGSYGAHILAKRWVNGAASVIIFQVPKLPAVKLPPIAQKSSSPQTPSAENANSHEASLPETRTQTLMALLTQPNKAILSVHQLSAEEIHGLLTPWLGLSPSAPHAAPLPLPALPNESQNKDPTTSSQKQNLFSLPLPDLIKVHLAPNAALPEPIIQQFHHLVPDGSIERSTQWSTRLHVLAISLQLCITIALGVVVAISIAVITIATKAGITARKNAIGIIHSLGASDGYIAHRFSRRIAFLAFLGGLAGTLLSLPFLIFLAQVVEPFSKGALQNPSSLPALALPTTTLNKLITTHQHLAPVLPSRTTTAHTLWFEPAVALSSPLLISLLMIPFIAAFIGWVTTQITVRTWLKRLL